MTVRLISQNKALHCYLVLSVWILLVIAGIYKFLDWDPQLNKTVDLVPGTTELFHNLGTAGVKTRRIFKICNFPEEIFQGQEGISDNKKWVLKGLIIVIRHGDRGPLQHVKRIWNINCNTEETSILKSYKSYLYNLTIAGKLQWTGPGPFHSFPVIPHPSQCHLGQLTMQGISQHLNLGQILRKSYYEIWPKLQQLRPEEVMVFSTRYRRTFQSALAFLYGLISNDTLAKVSIYESHSMSFCFKDCECPVTEHLKKLVQKSESHQLKSHPAIETLSQTTGKLLFSTDTEQSSLIRDPYVIRDALLAFACHRTGLPCDGPSNNCIRKQNVAGIIAYTDWVNYQKWGNIHWRRLCLLRSYGQIRHMVQQMLHMVGSNRPRMVLYSGHDFTLLQLTTALGLVNDPLLLRYASRLVFEVYQQENYDKNDEKGIYFRLLSNGKDVTRQIGFCRNIVNVDKRNIALCKIEDIVRFLHDDYFSSLNVTNFKDACVKKTEKAVDEDFFHFR